MVKLCLLALVAVSGIATAEPAQLPITFVIGSGATHHRMYKSPEDSGAIGWDLALELDVAYRLPAGFAIGLHGDASHISGIYHADGGAMDPFGYVAIDVGITVEYVIADRVWLAPWLGTHISRYSEPGYGVQWSATSLGYGATVGVDVLVSGPDRLTVFGGFATVPGDYPFADAYNATTLGLAYRR